MEQKVSISTNNKKIVDDLKEDKHKIIPISVSFIKILKHLTKESYLAWPLAVQMQYIYITLLKN